MIPTNFEIANMLEKDARCDYCQSLISNHKYMESLACLQELSKSHTEFREHYVADIAKVEQALRNV